MYPQSVASEFVVMARAPQVAIVDTDRYFLFAAGEMQDGALPLPEVNCPVIDVSGIYVECDADMCGAMVVFRETKDVDLLCVTLKKLGAKVFENSKEMSEVELIF